MGSENRSLRERRRRIDTTYGMPSALHGSVSPDEWGIRQLVSFKFWF